MRRRRLQESEWVSAGDLEVDRDRLTQLTVLRVLIFGRLVCALISLGSALGLRTE
jgi:hypothetical protein